MSEFSHLVEKIPTHLTEEASTQECRVLFIDGFNIEDKGIYHSPVATRDPYDLDLNRFIPNLPVSLEGFIDLVGSVIEDAQRREQIVSKERVIVTQEYNPEHFPELGDEVITFKILKREPARMTRDGKGRPNKSFGYAYEYRSAQEPNKVIAVESRPIDHLIEIAAWAKTSTLANRRALWLERLLIGHRWAFAIKGAKPFEWRERGPDTLWTPNGARLHQRPLKFFVRLKEFNILAFPTIKEFEFEMNNRLTLED